MKAKLPDMSSWTDEQIAKFWDTHSMTDYEDELEVVELDVKRPVRHTFELDTKHHTQVEQVIPIVERLIDEGVSVEIIMEQLESIAN